MRSWRTRAVVSSRIRRIRSMPRSAGSSVSRFSTRVPGSGLSGVGVSCFTTEADHRRRLSGPMVSARQGL